VSPSISPYRETMHLFSGFLSFWISALAEVHCYIQVYESTLWLYVGI
jgi:hypothetical protein